MKFVNPSFDILTDISSGGIKELKHIESNEFLDRINLILKS